MRSVTFSDSSAATSEQEVAGAWLRVFAEQLGGQVAEGASRDHDGDVEPEGCSLTRVAAAGEGAEWTPSRATLAEAILSVDSNRGVGCDMVPVELLKCYPAVECKDLEAAVSQYLSPDTASARVVGCLEVTVQKCKGSAEKRSVGLVNHTAKVFFKALLQRRLCLLRWEGSERGVLTEHRICRGPCGPGRQPEASQHAPCLSSSACRVNWHLAFLIQRRASRGAGSLAKSRVPATYCPVSVSRVIAGHYEDGLNTRPHVGGFGAQFCDAGRAAGGGREAAGRGPHRQC